MTYAEKLKDPRWQKKRLEIFERDGWECKLCFDKNKTLHVHHRSYSRGVEPWDYDNSMLVTLCCDCHDEVIETKDFCAQFLIHGLCSYGAWPSDIVSLAMAFASSKSPSNIAPTFAIGSIIHALNNEETNNAPFDGIRTNIQR